MVRISNMKIRPKLILFFLVTGLIPLIILGFFSDSLMSRSLTDESFSVLRTIQSIRKGQIEDALTERVNDIEMLAKSLRVRSLIGELTAYNESMGTHPDAGMSVNTTAYLQIHGDNSKYFSDYMDTYGYYDIALLDAKNGHILFSVLREDDLGTNLRTGEYRDGALATLWHRVMRTGRTQFVDFAPYEPSGGKQTAFWGTPVRDDLGNITGIIALQIRANFIATIMDSREGMGETGESYLLEYNTNSDVFSLRSRLKTIGQGKYVVGYELDHVLPYWRDAVKAGEAGGADTYVDSAGNPVLVAYSKLRTEGANWYLISKIDQLEVTAPTRGVAYRLLLLAGVMIVFIALLALSFSRQLTRPIQEDVRFALDIAEGRFDKTLDLDQKDELGQLAKALNTMAQKLSAQNWMSSGKEGLDDELRGEHSSVVLARKMIKYLARHMDAQLGVLYVQKDGIYELQASYSFTDRQGHFNSFREGEGIVGQVALENETILFSNVAEGAPTLNYGAGEVLPPHFLVAPIASEGIVYAVLLLGSMKPFTQLQKQFINLNTENLGILFDAAKSRETIHDLLENAQEQQKKLHLANEELEDQTRQLKESEAELQAQQEELRVTNEELEEQTKALKESEAELQAQQEELRVTNEELETHTQTLEQQQEAIGKKNAELVKAQEVVQQKARDLELASRYKSEFLANMSHELRTPLNSILILSQLFGSNRDGNLTNKQIESAKAIHSSGSDLLTLINEILDLSKVEAGKIELVLEDVPISQMVSDLNRMFKEVAKDKGVDFVMTVDESLPLIVHTDSQRVQQVLRNLLTNAFKFTNKGVVELAIIRPDKGHVPEWLDSNCSVAFSVRDDGIGIPKAQQMAIFEAFQQADGSTSREFGGTGLGLSISRELTKLLGGAIYLESEEGTGSTFTIVLPEVYTEPAPGGLTAPGGTCSDASLTAVVDGPAHKSVAVQGTPLVEQGSAKTERTDGEETKGTVTEKPQKPAQHSGRVADDRREVSPESKSLLIIEDDSKFATILRDFAREREFKCIVAEDGETGLHFADYYRPSAIILDIGLPGIDGWTVMERLKENPDLRHIPVHFMSAADANLDAMRMGAVGFLSKPVSMEKVEDAFSRIEDVISKPVSKLLLVEDDDIQRESIRELIGSGDVDIMAVATGTEAFEELNKGVYDCMILDLGLADMSGFELLEKIRMSETSSRVPIIVYTGRDLTRQEENQLNRYAESIIIKGAKSPERLLDESALFLHRVESELPEDKQKMLKMVHDKEAVFANKTILLVDDDMRNVFALSSVLEEKAMEVIIARNGLEALEKLKANNHVNLVLMDIMMPQMDGYEAMQEIRKERKYAKLPIIALTAKAMKGDRSKCIEAGANDYLAKPVNTDKLLSMLRVWLY